LPDNKVINQLLLDYFPQQAVERYGELLKRHPLAKEITATMLTNRVVDQAGSTFCQTLSRLTGQPQVAVANAYIVFDGLLGGASLRKAVFALDNQIPSRDQYQLLMELEDVLRSFCLFALGNGMALPVDEAELSRIEGQLKQYAALLPEVLSAENWQACQQERDQLSFAGLSEEMAFKYSALGYLVDFLPLICMAQQSGHDLEQLARLKVVVDEKIAGAAIEQLLTQVPVRDSWDRRAREALLGSLHSVMVRLVQQVATETADDPQVYFRKRRQKMRTFIDLRQTLLAETPRNFHPFTVLLRSLESLLAE
jgi:glutamate dehydrogenase